MPFPTAARSFFFTLVVPAHLLVVGFHPEKQRQGGSEGNHSLLLFKFYKRNMTNSSCDSSLERRLPSSSSGSARMTSTRAVPHRHRRPTVARTKRTAVFAVLSVGVLLLSFTDALVEASKVSAGRDASVNILSSAGNNYQHQKRHLRAASHTNKKAGGRTLDDATIALEAAEQAEEEEEAEEEPTVLQDEEDEEQHDEDDRDFIPEVEDQDEDEDLTPEEEAAAEELTGEDKNDAVEIVEDEAGDDEASPADGGDEVVDGSTPADDEDESEVPEDTAGSEEPEAAQTEEEESPAMGTTEEGTTGDDMGEDEGEDAPADEQDEEEALDQEILDELANEEGNLPEDVVEEINDEIEGILDAVAGAASGEPTMAETIMDSIEDSEGDETFDEGTEQWTPVGAPTVDQEQVQAPTVDYGNDMEGPAPTADYFEFKMTPEPTKPYTPPDEDYDPLDGIDAEEEEGSLYGSTGGGSGKEPVESPFEDGSWQDEAYKTAYDWLNGGEGEEDMAAVARDQRVKVAVGVLLGLGVTLALITASCALNKPDGLCAGCCRLILKLISCICHILCLPCRVCCGGKRQEERQGATLVGRSDLEFS